MFDSVRTYIAAFFRKPIVETAVKAGATAYAGGAGAKAVEIVGPKIVEAIDPK